MQDINKALDALKLGDKKRAFSIARKINKNKKKQSFHSIRLEGLEEFEKNNVKRAMLLLENALSRAHQEAAPAESVAEVHTYLAHSLIASGKDEQAIAQLEKAKAILPQARSISTRYNLANLKLKTFQLEEAITELKKLLPYSDFTIKATKSLIKAAIQLSDKEMISQYVNQMMGRINELKVSDLKFLISIAEWARATDIEFLINNLESRNLLPEYVALLRANKLMSEKKYDECLALIDDTAKYQLDDQNLSYLLSLKGNALEGLKDYNQAFDVYTEMNALKAKQSKQNKIQPSSIATRSDWSVPERNPEEASSFKIAFLVGFPRSGTTLLENVLDSQPDIVALGEKPMIADTARLLDKKFPKVGVDYSKLDSDALLLLRENYLRVFREYARIDQFSEEKVYIDKEPFNLLSVPLIKSIFPEAKIIVALRHPLDCILSCFFQNFVSSPETSHFEDIERTFTRYADTFNLYNTYAQRFGSDIVEVRYEDMLNQFDNEMSKVFEFIGTKYDAELAKSFNKVAGQKLINTASRDQVKAELYNTSIQRWKNYANVIQPLIPKVETHIKQFGYSI